MKQLLMASYQPLKQRFNKKSMRKTFYKSAKVAEYFFSNNKKRNLLQLSSPEYRLRIIFFLLNLDVQLLKLINELETKFR